MLATGFPRADAENDFARARRRQVLAALARRLRRQAADSVRLLPLDQVTSALGWRGERQLGLRTIRLDTIVGTTEPRRDFDRQFRPTSGRTRSRWERLALAERRGAALPPIEVYRVSDLHFVSDGHHRVSIAAATGRQTIDAYVTEVLTTRAAGPTSSWPHGPSVARCVAGPPMPRVTGRGIGQGAVQAGPGRRRPGRRTAAEPCAFDAGR